jgi:L-aspartate oxidase
VFGARAGAAMRDWAGTAAPLDAAIREVRFPCAAEAEVRAAAWDLCGIVRTGDGLRQAVRWFEDRELRGGPDGGRAGADVRNLLQVALLIARSALGREESRGAHYRLDFPAKSNAFERHSVIRKGSEVAFR